MPKRREMEWSLDGMAPPVGVSMLQHASSLLPASGRGPLPRDGHPLPDEGPPDPSKLNWSSGVFDSLQAVRGGRAAGNEPLVAAAAIDELVHGQPTQERLEVAIARLDAVRGPQQSDRLLAAIRPIGEPRRARVAALGRWLCEHGTRRQVVKAGMAMLGVAGGASDRSLVSRLGLVHEFSLYAVVALQNLGADDLEVMDFGKQVEGWGRIHVIQRLKDTDEPAIQAWFVRGGASIGSFLTEEIAFVAATAGRLAATLAGPVDDDLFDGAGELLRALAVGGSAEDLSDYPEGAVAIEHFLAAAIGM